MSPLYSFEFNYSQRGEGVIEAPDESAAWDLVSERLDEFESRGDLEIIFDEL